MLFAEGVEGSMATREDEIADLKRRLAELESAPQTASDSGLGGPRKRASPWPVIAVVVVFGAVVLVANGAFKSTPAPPQQSQAQTLAALAQNTPTPPEPAWTYTPVTDPMVDKAGQMACVKSTNQVHLQPPYSDVQAELCIRRSPKGTVNILLSLLGDGQMLCHSYETCPAMVRFDDAAARRISAQGPSDGSTNVIFLLGEAALVPKIKAASVMRVQKEFYNAGVQTIEFPTKGLNW